MKGMASPIFSRRDVLCSAVASVLLATASRAARGAVTAMEGASASPLVFDVVWSDDVVGSHVVAFEAVDEDLRVHTTIDIDVKVLWMSVFSYKHRSTETWRAGRLVSFESNTLDNGRKDTVEGQARDDGFVVTGRKGTLVAPADIIPATFWNPEIVSRTVVLDPKKGTLEDQVVLGHDRFRLTVGGQPRDVTRYRLDSVLNGAVYYDDQRRWAGAWFKKRGGRIDYRLRS